MNARVAFLLYGLLSGPNFIFMKLAASSISPMQIAFLRVLFGLLPLAAFAWQQGVLDRRQLRHLPHFLVMGVVATAFYFLAISQGTARLPSGLASVLANANMLFTALLSVMFLKDERINGLMAAGIVVGFLGIALIARPWEGAHGAIDPAGVFWVLTSAVVLGASYVYVRVFLTPLALPPLALATWQMGVAAIVLGGTTDISGVAVLFSDSLVASGLIVGGGILGTGVAFFLYYYLLEELGAVAASSATYLAPAVALVIGWGAGERFGAVEFAALSLIVLGVLVLQFGRQRLLRVAVPAA